MIAALRRAAAYTGRLIEAAVNARTLARTVRILARQLDNAHLLAASEGARADRAELVAAERGDRIDELEAALQDWREASGELAAEQPAADALPDLTDAGEAPTSVVDHAREAAYQCDRANALAATLHATEAVVLSLRGRIQSLEREAKEAGARLQQTERAAGAHIATIEALREQIAAAHRAAHAIGPAASFEGDWCIPHGIHKCRHCSAPAEQIPGVAAAALTESERREGYHFGKLTGIGFAAGCEAIAETKAARGAAGADDPPPTRPSSATRTT